jgi:hypothetical protein
MENGSPPCRAHWKNKRVALVLVCSAIVAIGVWTGIKYWLPGRAPRSLAEAIDQLKRSRDLPLDAQVQIPPMARSLLGFTVTGPPQQRRVDLSSRCYRVSETRPIESLAEIEIQYASLAGVAADFSPKGIAASTKDTTNGQAVLKLKGTFVRSTTGVYDEASSCELDGHIVTWEWGADSIVLNFRAAANGNSALSALSNFSSELTWEVGSNGTYMAKDVILAFSSKFLVTTKSNPITTILRNPIQPGMPIQLPEGTPSDVAVSLLSFDRSSSHPLVLALTGAHSFASNCHTGVASPFCIEIALGQLCAIDFESASTLTIKAVDARSSPDRGFELQTTHYRTISRRSESSGRKGDMP